jgi:hypothetical protein
MGTLQPATRETRNFLRLVYGIDPEPVVRRIAAMPELWSQITARQTYEGTAHADTETIFLRAPSRTQGVLDCIESVEMPAMQALEMTEVMDALVREIGIRDLGRVMLVKLKPSGVIFPHTDEGAYARYYARFHCVLTTSAECMFYVGGESVHMAAGEVWWFNHRLQHEVVNGNRERIHLIFDGAAPGFCGALA